MHETTRRRLDQAMEHHLETFIRPSEQEDAALYVLGRCDAKDLGSFACWDKNMGGLTAYGVCLLPFESDVFREHGAEARQIGWLRPLRATIEQLYAQRFGPTRAGEFFDLLCDEPRPDTAVEDLKEHLRNMSDICQLTNFEVESAAFQTMITILDTPAATSSVDRAARYLWSGYSDPEMQAFYLGKATEYLLASAQEAWL